MALVNLCRGCRYELPFLQRSASSVCRSVYKKSNLPVRLRTPSLNNSLSFSRFTSTLISSDFLRRSASEQIYKYVKPNLCHVVGNTATPCKISKLSYSNTAPENLEEIHSEVVRVRPYYGLLRLSGDVRFVVTPDIENQCGTVCRLRLLTSDRRRRPAEMQVRLQDEASVVKVEVLQQKDDSVVCEVKLPVKYDIKASLKGKGSIEISELQNEETSVATEEGSLTVHKLQALHLQYRTNAGPLIIGRKLLGNLDASARSSLKISGDMIQAESVVLQGPAVECHLQGVHAKSLRVDADDARLHLTDVTCDEASFNAQSAHVAVGNYSGSLSWKFKSATLEVAVPKLLSDSSINVGAGRISIGCPAEYRYGLSAVVPEISVTSDFKEVTRSSAGGMSRVTAGPSSPVLSVSLEKGQCAVVPWAWPRTMH